MFVVTLPSRAAGEPAAFARRAQAAGAQLLEIRGDLTPWLAPFDSALPLLVAPRGVAGAWVARLGPILVDLELGEPEEHAVAGAGRILSFHDHRRTPGLGDLRAVVEALDRGGGDILKLATMVNDLEDLATLEALQRESWRCERLRGRTVVLGMGAKARLNRLQSPWRNVLTYACLDGEPLAAPGQVSLQDYAACRPAVAVTRAATHPS